MGTFSAAALLLRPFTIVRTHLYFNVLSDQVSAVEVARGALGLAVVSDQAIAAGIGSVPGPVTDGDASSWFLWEAWISNFISSTNVGLNSEAGTFQRVDSKAMRKVGPNEDLALVYENSDGAHGVNVVTMGRMLLKLH